MKSRMKTVVFYSYKGGSGRSLAMINVALCLARCRKNVVMMDMDFGAPGLPDKAASVAPSMTIKDGFVRYLTDQLALLESSPNLQQARPLGEIPVRLFPNPQDPNITLIPAGNPDDMNYWGLLSDARWIRFFTPSLLEANERIQNTGLLESIKETISNLDPPPDYLLIDSRSGLNTYQNHLFRLWADTVVYFATSSPDALTPFQYFLRQLNEIESKSGEQLTIVPVVSRVPSGESRSPAVIGKIEEALRLSRAETMIVTLHADREVEFHERLRIAPRGQTSNTRLAHEYVELAARLETENSSDSKHLEQTREEIRRAVELGASRGEVDRYFTLVTTTGELVNPHDGTPNVSFKRETLVVLLSQLHAQAQRTAYEAGKPKAETADIVDRMYHAAGFNCGSNFGSSLLHLWSRDARELVDRKDANVLHDRIAAWCEFDSDVGFGRFDSANKDGKPAIRIVSHFLAQDLDAQGPSLCHFMEGYIGGVLDRILDGRTVTVEHPDNQCSRFHPVLDYCDFTLKIDPDLDCD